jgi:Raf kinase inhibitor-like YbhB/YbcL family protein
MKVQKFRSRVQNVSLKGLAVGLAIALGACATASQQPSSSPQVARLTLTSPTFADNEEIPVDQTCDGKNLSPTLTWDAPPPATQSFVVLVEDPDARQFTHWLIYDLPPKLRELPAGVPPQPFLPMGGGHGKNDFKRYGYGGPCPPRGTHRYVFKIFALSQLLDLPAGATKAEVLEAMTGKVLAEGEWIGKYTRKR